MRRVAYAQKPRTPPAPHAINPNCQKAYVVPVSQLANAVTEDWLQVGNIRAKLFDSPLANLIRGALRNEKSALPVILAVDHDEHSARFDVPQGLTRIAGTPADPHPQDIHGSA